jgi:LacI family transcriptional regulator
MKVTLKNIAEEAGVSVSMVSYVLNRSGRITNEKHKKIIEIANKYNYVPDANAKGLVTGVNNNIGFVVNKDAESIFQQPFIMQCIGEFSKYLRQYSGWISLCMARSMDVEKMRSYMANANFDGIVFLFAEYPDKIAELLKVRKTPCIFWDSATNCENVAEINCDDDQGIRMAVDYLVSIGHKRIMFLAAKNISDPGDIRQKAYCKAIRDNNLEYEKIVSTGYEKHRIYKMLDQLMPSEEKPTAIVAATDKIAWGAIDYLREHNVKVPETVSIIGFDDADIMQNEEYGLTTIRQPVYEMVKASVDYIFECQEAKELKSYRDRKMPSLIIRSSTAPSIKM